ncbi:MAG: nucleoside hydrolase [Bacteroidota bacterium]|nr:nucleoside hydrolase [Bacteroidota bacterium]
MNRRSLLLILSLIILTIPAIAHKKAEYNLIVDTDAGIDDFRMLQFILASKDFNVNAIVTNDGVLSPQQGAKRIKGMLEYCGHEGIPVASGKSLNKKFVHRDFASSLVWPGHSDDVYQKDAIALIHDRLNAHRSKDIYLVSGTLTNLAALLKAYPEDSVQISRVIWYHNPDDPGMNYTRDSLSAIYVLEHISRVEFVCNPNAYRLSDDYFLALKSMDNKYAMAVTDFHSEKVQEGNSGQIPVYLWDGCLPVYVLFPQYFVQNENANVPESPEELEMLMMGILDVNKPTEGVVYKNMPVDKPWLQDDVANLADSIISAHGYDAFNVIAMTNEFHGHLGIYSIIGAKMGIRATEYFHVGLDELEVWSYAGKTPPLSCMHDGLQFSTGASLGYGSIHVVEADEYRPVAEFEYKGMRIKMALRDKYIRQFEKDIELAIKKYGNLTEAYWDDVRRNGLMYWLKLDRNKIFDVVQQK